MGVFAPRFEDLTQALLDELDELAFRLQDLRSRGPGPASRARVSFWLVACRDAGHRLRQARSGDVLPAIVDVKAMLVKANEDCRLALVEAQPILREGPPAAGREMVALLDAQGRR